MKKLLAIPNDPTSAYFRSSREDFLGEFNPKYDGSRRFDEVRFLNWRDEKDTSFQGVDSKAFLKDKSLVEKLYRGLTNLEIPFDSEEGSFSALFEVEADLVRKFVSEYNPDLIRAFNTHFAVELGILARRYSGAPLMVSGHDPTRLTPAIAGVDAMVCESYELRNLCLEEFGVNPQDISVIHNGIDLDFFSPRSTSSIAEYVPAEFLDAPYKVFSSSRLVKGKNIETLMKSLALVKDELPGLVHLHLGAAGSQPEKAAEIMDLRGELGLESTSHFLGAKQKKELPFYYSWADVFVLPTLWEGLSRVMRESLACGTPVITTNYGSSAEIVQTGFNGVGVDPMNEEEIAEAILETLKDDIFRKKLSNNSRPSVEKYSLPLSMELYSKLYAELSR
ncbi:glycosyltransferase family 4 protein [archaeon]|jgi:glycosyltransferase involved in cell wall biosynthesis|nr:glycosyltransferase family 4 protein [archaeon]